MNRRENKQKTHSGFGVGFLFALRGKYREIPAYGAVWMTASAAVKKSSVSQLPSLQPMV